MSTMSEDLGASESALSNESNKVQAEIREQTVAQDSDRERRTERALAGEYKAVVAGLNTRMEERVTLGAASMAAAGLVPLGWILYCIPDLL